MIYLLLKDISLRGIYCSSDDYMYRNYNQSFNIYKLLDNIGPIGAWLSGLFHILMPFIIGILIAYLFYIPCRGLERCYKSVKKPKIISKKI